MRSLAGTKIAHFLNQPICPFWKSSEGLSRLLYIVEGQVAGFHKVHHHQADAELADKPPCLQGHFSEHTRTTSR
jgi:hypothetical protein